MRRNKTRWEAFLASRRWTRLRGAGSTMLSARETKPATQRVEESAVLHFWSQPQEASISFADVRSRSMAEVIASKRVATGLVTFSASARKTNGRRVTAIRTSSRAGIPPVARPGRGGPAKWKNRACVCRASLCQGVSDPPRRVKGRASLLVLQSPEYRYPGSPGRSRRPQVHPEPVGHRSTTSSLMAESSPLWRSISGCNSA